MADRSQNKFLYVMWLPGGENGVEKEAMIGVNSIVMIIPSDPPNTFSLIFLSNGERMLVKDRFDSLTELLIGALD